MKVLQVIHDFLPYHAAGAEIYTYNLSKQLAANGHDVHLLFTEMRHERPQYEVTTGEYDGLPYHEVVWNFQHEHFRQTYVDEKMHPIVRDVLDEVRPDIVHLQHFLFFGVGMIDLIHERGIPIVFTLHEYCLTCSRWGLRMTEQLELCHDLDVAKCAGCIRHENVADDGTPAQPKRKSWLGKLFNRGGATPQELPANVPGDLVAHARAIQTRWQVVRSKLEKVDHFIAPSPFLRQKFIEFGIPENKIEFSDYGFRVDEFASPPPKTESDKLRFGYLGTLSEHKGIRTLVHAMNRIDASRAELQIYGDPTFFREFMEEIEKEDKSDAIRFMGRFENTGVADVLASIDVLVVPSMWFENSPLTIHEAFMSKVPVVTTDLGGMKDLVEHDVSGLLFDRANAEDLAAKLQRFLDEPGLVEKLAAGIPDVKPIEQDAAEIEKRYRSLVGTN